MGLAPGSRMTIRCRWLLPALLALAVVPALAHAFTSVPGHADIKVKPRATNGQTKGCTLTFCVRTPLGGYHRAFPALMDPQVAYALKNGNRAATINPALGSIRIALPVVDVPTANTVIQVSHELDYATHGLASGMKVYLVTSWPGTGTTGSTDRADPSNHSPHVFGTITATGTEHEITLP